MSGSINNDQSSSGSDADIYWDQDDAGTQFQSAQQGEAGVASAAHDARIGSAGFANAGGASNTEPASTQQPVATDNIPQTGGVNHALPSADIHDYVTFGDTENVHEGDIPVASTEARRQSVLDDLQAMLSSSGTFRNDLYDATQGGTNRVTLTIDEGASPLAEQQNSRTALNQIIRQAHQPDRFENLRNYLRGDYDQANGGALNTAVEQGVRVGFQAAREFYQIGRESGGAGNVGNSAGLEYQLYGQERSSSPVNWSFDLFRNSEIGLQESDEVRARLDRSRAQQQQSQSRVQNDISDLQADAQNADEHNQNDLQHRLNQIRTSADGVIYNPSDRSAVNHQIETLQSSIDNGHYNSIQESANDLLQNIQDASGNQSTPPVSNWQDSLDHIRGLILRSTDYTSARIDALLDQVAGIQNTISQTLAGPSTSRGVSSATVARAIQAAVGVLVYQVAHTSSDPYTNLQSGG